MAGSAALDAGRVRAAEVSGALCLATDSGWGCRSSTACRARCSRSGWRAAPAPDEDAVRDAYYLCLLFHAGCMTDAHVAAQIFGGDLSSTRCP